MNPHPMRADAHARNTPHMRTRTQHTATWFALSEGSFGPIGCAGIDGTAQLVFSAVIRPPPESQTAYLVREAEMTERAGETNT